LFGLQPGRSAKGALGPQGVAAQEQGPEGNTGEST